MFALALGCDFEACDWKCSLRLRLHLLPTFKFVSFRISSCSLTNFKFAAFKLLLELTRNHSGLHHMTTQCHSEHLEALQHAQVEAERTCEAESAARVAARLAAQRAACERAMTFQDQELTIPSDWSTMGSGHGYPFPPRDNYPSIVIVRNPTN